MVVRLDRLTPYQRTAGRAAIRREQRGQLESNHHENRATGKEGEAYMSQARPLGK
jgi:hypothetical protein